MEILRTEDLKKYYGEGETCIKALDGVNFTVEKGEFVSIVGTSGSGKSTLLHMLGGAGSSYLREGGGGRKKYFFPEGGSTDDFQEEKDRLCVSEL